MGLSVATNVAALSTQRTLARNDESMTVSLRRLSSGLRINSAADDAAGLSIAEGLRSQIRGGAVAGRNLQDGINVLRTAEGALAETSSILQRWNELVIQRLNEGALDSAAVANIQTETRALRTEIDRIARKTTFNGISLLDGSFERDFQVGAAAGDTVRVTIPEDGRPLDMAGLLLSIGSGIEAPSTVTPAVSAAQGTPTPGVLSLDGAFGSPTDGPYAFRTLAGRVSYAGQTFDLGSVDYTGAVTAQDHLDRLNAASTAALGTAFAQAAPGLVLTGATPGPASTAADAAALTPRYWAPDSTAVIGELIDRVASVRASLGAMENRFEHTAAGLSVAVENLTAAESRIRDTDMAQEMAAFTRHQVLGQAGTAMLSQAQSTAQTVLSLLG
ncbi:flagellin N-terminal helical domain-containing protein [Blastococcus sp. SYSU DS0617]